MRLLLMRHAKSSWRDRELGDHDRPLNGRGRRTAPAIGARLVALGHQPELVLVSSAQRTRETAALLQPAWQAALPEEIVCPGLYLGGLRSLDTAMEAHAGEHRTILALGHNPGWSVAASRLARQAVELKTADVAILAHPAPDWASTRAREGDWVLEDILRGRACVP